MDHISISALRRSGHPHDAVGALPPQKARRLTADSSVSPNGSLLQSSNPTSPGGLPDTPASVACGRGGGADGGGDGCSGLATTHQQQYPYNHQADETTTAAVGLAGGHPESQRLEVALDDTMDDPRAGDGGIGVGDGGAPGTDGGGGNPHDTPHEAVQEGPLTETIAAGLIGMRQRRATIEQQIDDLTNVAVEFLEATKKDFVERMARLKNNVALFCNGQEAEWRETNALTQEALGRLDAARSLVRSLGLNANSAGQALPAGEEEGALFAGQGHGHADGADGIQPDSGDARGAGSHML